MRGERTDEAAKTYAGDGSSPHARGTPTFYRLYTVKSRFIPACAGNARTVAVSALPSTVHPRMRGERKQVLNLLCIDKRFIPACAGNA